MLNRWFELIGWYGSFALLLGYALISFGVLDATRITYQLLVLTGAIGLIVISINKKVYQTVVINLLSALIAAFVIIQLLLR